MHRLLPLVFLFASSALAAPLQSRVLVVSFQSLGLSPETMGRVGDTLRTELSAQQWVPIDGAETQRVLRAASMCGEDVECLATLGQRADARWVLAWGFGKIGSSYLFTSLLVETASSTKRSTFTEKVASADADAGPLARSAVSALFQNVSRAAAPSAETSGRRLLAPTLASAGVGVAATALTVIFGVLAATNYGQLQTALPAEQARLTGQQRTWNLVADVSLGTAIAAGATALVLFILGAPAQPTPAEVRP
ncbi:MAG: hypothetical protein MUC96_05100 [Myxococcaceae bacterium]|jgi:hypothetical protein|nr:hypothetical protein [Myxococcaceae bacterium]